jgi:hypothetical protein
VREQSIGPLPVKVHTIQITVHKIDGFSDYAGSLDRTNPYVLLQLGKEKQQTSVKNDMIPCEKSRYCLVRRVVASSVTGGKKVIFDETFTFLMEGEELKDITVKVEIYDKDSMGGDELGTCDVNLQNLQDTQKKVTSVKKARRRSAVECVV